MRIIHGTTVNDHHVREAVLQLVDAGFDQGDILLVPGIDDADAGGSRFGSRFSAGLALQACSPPTARDGRRIFVMVDGMAERSRAEGIFTEAGVRDIACVPLVEAHPRTIPERDQASAYYPRSFHPSDS